MYLLGYDIGSSSIKAALLEAETKTVLASAQYPDQDMDIIARQRGWAEQQPEVWWQDFCILTQRILVQTGIDSTLIQGIGIAYQMHGLVLIDEAQQVLRPSIIWCDSRAVAIGEQSFQALGADYCLENLLNAPGNFTASKLKWVKDNEPAIYEKADKVLLPGDYIAMRLTGEVVTTISGLTEGIFWNFKDRSVDDRLLEHYGLRRDLLSDTVPTFSEQGFVSKKAAIRTGLAEGTPITYRAGDQPNNALALNVLHPGEVAATSGTSGVVYGIVDKPLYDPKSRVNAFAHVNYEHAFNRIGVLLCLNGAGIEYSWIKHQVARHLHTYQDMERMASTVPIGSEGLSILPFGNGAERILENKEPNANIFNLQFNRHSRGHMFRAALEGVAFSFVYGIQVLKEMGLDVDVMRVGNDNMFQSSIFSTTIATLLDSQIEVVDTNGAIGAAKAAGIAAGLYANLEEALSDVQALKVYEPNYNRGLCEQAYSYWQANLNRMLRTNPRSDQDSFFAKNKVGELTKELKQKNRALAMLSLRQDQIKSSLSDLEKELKKAEMLAEQDSLKEILKKLRQKVNQEIDPTDNWQQFEKHFNLLHADFFEKLKYAFPELGISDLKMCAYLKLGLSNKEMANHLNLSLRGIETRRYRLNKKLKLGKHINLKSYLESL